MSLTGISVYGVIDGVDRHIYDMHIHVDVPNEMKRKVKESASMGLRYLGIEPTSVQALELSTIEL